MLQRLFSALAALAYGAYVSRLDEERRAAAAAFRAMKERRARRFERQVLVGR